MICRHDLLHGKNLAYKDFQGMNGGAGPPAVPPSDSAV